MTAERPELTVFFPDARALVAQRPHVEQGGFFVPPPTPPPEALSELRLHVVPPEGRPLSLDVRVVQALEVGVALTFLRPDEARRDLDPVLDAPSVRAAEPGGGEPPRVHWGAPRADDASAPAAAAPSGATRGEDGGGGTLLDQIRGMSTAEKRQLALKGDRAARLLLLKDTNKQVHVYIIKNPGITPEEVRYIAAYRQTNPEVLKLISENREWMQNPTIVAGLVGNPKTPTSVSLKLVDRLPTHELRRLARGDGVPHALAKAARTRLIGPK